MFAIVLLVRLNSNFKLIKSHTIFFKVYIVNLSNIPGFSCAHTLFLTSCDKMKKKVGKKSINLSLHFRHPSSNSSLFKSFRPIRKTH